MERRGNRDRSHKRRFSTNTCLLFLVLLSCVPMWTQIEVGTPSSAPAASKPAVPKDALGRTTPRGTVLGFVSAARKGGLRASRPVHEF